MHIIQDLEGFLKHVEEVIHVWFGNGRAAEEGKDAILAAIVASGSPVLTGTLTKAEPVKLDKKKLLIEAKVGEIVNV